MTDIYQEIMDLKSRGEDAALATIVSSGGSAPRKEGAKMLVKADGSTIGTIGGGAVELIVTREALKAIQTGKAKRLEYSLAEGGEPGMICGGNVEVFVEPLLSTPSLYILGGGHIGLVLANIGKIAGFKIIVIDNRPEYASAARFPEADQTIVAEYSEVFEKLAIDSSSYIVIITHGHKGDEASLAEALGTKAKYIGMIGSKKKNAAVFEHLVKKGFPREQLEKVHAPIGLSIYAQTPEEIAISIMAEIIAVRRAPAA